MKNSLRALLSEIIDYAGMFPPARLPLDEAIRNFARYLGEPESWMLGRFICPAAKLEELRPYRDELFNAERPLRLSVLGSGGADTREFHANLGRDVGCIGRFVANGPDDSTREILDRPIASLGLSARARNCLDAVPIATVGELLQLDEAALLSIRSFGRTSVEEVTRKLDQLGVTRPLASVAPAEAFEVRLPSDLRATQVGSFLTDVEARFRDAGVGMPVEVYELRPDQAGLELIACFSPGNLKRLEGRARQRLNVKLRCGGVEPAMIPSTETVAKVIGLCRDAEVPLKFTAGLHHPVRHVDAGMQTHLHGFLNVFVATILARTHLLDPPDILAILEEEDPRQFRFDDDFLGWNEIEASTDEIQHARRRYAISFGSCSFDEPRDDLKRLGLFST